MENEKVFDVGEMFLQRFTELVEDATREEIAGRTGSSRQCVGNWLNGKSRPDIFALSGIARGYGVSVDWLLGLTDVKTADTTIQGVCNYTGLTEQAATLLTEMRNCEEQATGALDNGEDDWEKLELYAHKGRLPIVNKFFACNNFLPFIDAVKELYDYEISNFQELRTNDEKRERIVSKVQFSDVHRYRAQQELEKILDEFDIRNTPGLARELNYFYMQKISRTINNPTNDRKDGE